LREVARRIGVSNVAVCHWESGRAQPITENRAALEKVLRIKI
jgi:ribosome-binding protein aMBF1 (putative translation factor)